MNLIQLLANARTKFLQNTFNLSEADAQTQVNNEIVLLNANPSNTTVAGNAGDTIPTAVTLASVIETAPIGRWSFINALSAGRQPLQSLTNEYPIFGDIEAAGGSSEWTSGGIHDGEEATESFGAGKVTIIPKGIYASYGISRELLQYSMVELVPIALKRLSEAMMLNIATSIINGDSVNTTANINSFGVTPATAFPKGLKDARVMRDNGLRKGALAGAAGTTRISIGTPNGADDIFDAMKLVSFGGMPDDYVILMDKRTYYTYMKNDDFKDAAKNGKSSTIVTGAITNIAGSDLFVTDLVPLTDANGVVNATTPANNTKGSIIITKKNSIQHGFFGNVQFDTQYSLQKGVLVEAVADFGFENISTTAGRNETVLLYNIDVA